MDMRKFNSVKRDHINSLGAGNPLMVAEWFKNPEAWDKTVFHQEVVDSVSSYGEGCAMDGHLIAMLVCQMDIYVTAWRGICSEGLLIDFNGGQTRGRSPYLTTADQSLKRVMLLLAELRLMPSGRPRSTRRIQEFLRGP